MRRMNISYGAIALALLVLVASGFALAVFTADPAAAGPAAQDATPTGAVTALVAVERAIVFPVPDRNAEARTYLYERERVPVVGQHPDGMFLLVMVGDVTGWVLRAQVDLEGDLSAVPQMASADALPQVPPSLTFTPYQPPTATRPVTGSVTVAPSPFPSRTPLPTRTPASPATTGSTGITPEELDATLTALTLTPRADEDPVLIPGVPPPVSLTLPEGWESVDLVVALQLFDDSLRDLPLTIYFGPLGPDAIGLIYLYWGFPNTVDLASGDYNLWADGVQILRGSLVGQSCNLGVYDQQAFSVGEREGIGANYQASECENENDTAGWFSVLRVDEGNYAFYTAVEPWNALPDYVDELQAILDTVVFEDVDAVPTATP